MAHHSTSGFNPKQLVIACALVTLMATAAHAQNARTLVEVTPPTSQPVAPAEDPAASVRHTLKRVAKAEKILVGTWRSVEDEAKKMPPGSMFFQPNGAILIAPDNYKPLVGTWTANAQDILLATPGQGDVLVHYALSKDHKLLSMHYDNGLEQKFFRLPTIKGKNP